MLIFTAVPATAVLAGRRADHDALEQARAQKATTHVVPAVLVEPAPAVEAPDPYAGAEVVWVPARWTAPNGIHRTGDGLAPAEAGLGSTVPTWVDASGDFADPPPGHSQVAGTVFMAVTLAGLSLLALLIGAESVSHHLLERRRLNGWHAHWRAVAPRWTGHRT
ncbi:MAG TPA: hypothetical protein VGD68_17680 [Streptosporangiaceae bacterium]